MKLKKDTTYLITTDDWFLAPDGEQYKAVFGTFKEIHNDFETLGIKTNRGSANWFVEIGNMMIAGCQIHYTTKTDKVNYTPRVREIEYEGVCRKSTHHKTIIYNADEDNT